jgi:hypothetical protein
MRWDFVANILCERWKNDGIPLHERLDLPSARSAGLFHSAAYTDRRVPDATGHGIEEIISARFLR